MNRDDDSSVDSIETDSSSSHDSLNLGDKGIGEVVQGLLNDFPMRFYVIQWFDQEDEFDWRFVAGNEPAGQTTDLKLKDIVGRRVDDVYPGTKGDKGLFGLYKKTATTGLPVEYDYINEATQLRARATQSALPNNTILVVYEDLNHLDELKAKKDQSEAKMDALLDKAVELMIHAKASGDSDDLSMISLKGMLKFNSTARESGPSNVLVEEFEKKQKVISVADVETLVRNLSVESEDNAFSRQFLTSFRYFMSPSALLKKLIVKFMTVEKEKKRGWSSGDLSRSLENTNITRLEVDAASKSEKESPEDKVIDTLKIWLSDHFYDFDNDPELLKMLQEFINNSLLTSENTVHLGKSLNKLIAKNLRAEMASNSSLTGSEDFTANTLRSKVVIANENPIEIAHQLTLICFEIFKAVKPIEFYGQSWSKPNAQILSPNILDMIKNFNNITNWVSTEVLLQFAMKDRIQVLKRFIEVAWAAYGYRDFETTFAVMLGLGSLTVSRLTETWRGLDSNTKQKYYKLSEFTSYKMNFKTYRKKINQIISSPLGGNVIPYFSLYLKDMTVMEENNNFSQVAVGAVNFHKMRKVASTIGDIQKAQKSIFAFQKNVKLLVYLSKELTHVGEDAQWVLSKKCEAESSGLDPEEICAVAAMSPASILRSITRSASDGEVIVRCSNPIFGVFLPKGSLKSPVMKRNSSASRV